MQEILTSTSTMKMMRMQLASRSPCSIVFIQHVARPTCKSGNILDLIIMESFSEINIHSCILGCLLSDHYMINCKTSLRHQEICHRDINYCDLANINLELMEEYIKLDITDEDTLDILVEKLEDTLRSALDKHATQQTKSVVKRHKVPWFTEAVRDTKKWMRHREKLWRKYSTEDLWPAFKVVRWQHKTSIRKVSCEILSDKIQTVKGTQGNCTPFCLTWWGQIQKIHYLKVTTWKNWQMSLQTFS